MRLQETVLRGGSGCTFVRWILVWGVMKDKSCRSIALRRSAMLFKRCIPFLGGEGGDCCCS